MLPEVVSILVEINFHASYYQRTNYEGVLISPSPTYFPMSWDGIDSVVGKRGLFMCRIARLFLLQRL